MKNKNFKIVILILKIARVLLEIAMIFLAYRCNTEMMLIALRLVVILEFVIELCNVIQG